MKKTLYSLVAIFIGLSTVSAQHKTVPDRQVPQVTTADSSMSAVQIVTMSDGTKLTGKVVSMDAETLTFKVNGVEKPITLNRKMVASVQNIEATEFEITHRGAVGLLSTQTAFMIKKGHGVYENVGVVFANHVDFGVTDNVNVGLGFDAYLIRGQFKFGGEIAKNVHAALNVSGATTPFVSVSTVNGIPNNSGLGIWYINGQGLFTFGTPNQFLNVGLGAAILGSNSNNTANSPTASLTLGGFSRMSDHWGFMSDNIIFPGQTSTIQGYTSKTSAFIATMGARYLGRKASFDFGLSAISNSNSNTYTNSYYGAPNTTTSTFSLIVLPYVGMKAYW